MVTSTFGMALARLPCPLTLPSPPMGERDPRGRDARELDDAREQRALLRLRGGGVTPKAPVYLDVAEQSRGVLMEVEEGISLAIKDAATPLGQRGAGADHSQDGLETIKGAGAGMFHADGPGAPGAPIPRRLSRPGRRRRARVGRSPGAERGSCSRADGRTSGACSTGPRAR